jgi:hypothetical protein
VFCLIVYLVCLSVCSVLLLNGFVLLTCFHHNHFLLHSNHILMRRPTFKLDGENPPGVLPEGETCRCALLNQCDMMSCSGSIRITINCNCPKQVQMTIYYLNFVIICGLDFICVCMYYYPHTILVYFIFFIQCSLIYSIDTLPRHDFLHVCKVISYMLAEVFQSEGSHGMVFDGVYQIMVFILYCSAN